MNFTGNTPGMSFTASLNGLISPVTSIGVARIAEFAWHKMEPVEGQFDFGWLHRVVNSLKENGIRVIMGTPTATPPVWLIRSHPDVALLGSDGIRVRHGGRRHCCSNNPHYIQASRNIVARLAEEFGRDENIIGWQIDNEGKTDKTAVLPPIEHRKSEP